MKNSTPKEDIANTTTSTEVKEEKSDDIIEIKSNDRAEMRKELEKVIGEINKDSNLNYRVKFTHKDYGEGGITLILKEELNKFELKQNSKKDIKKDKYIQYARKFANSVGFTMGQISAISKFLLSLKKETKSQTKEEREEGLLSNYQSLQRHISTSEYSEKIEEIKKNGLITYFLEQHKQKYSYSKKEFLEAVLNNKKFSLEPIYNKKFGYIKSFNANEVELASIDILTKTNIGDKYDYHIGLLIISNLLDLIESSTNEVKEYLDCKHKKLNKKYSDIIQQTLRQLQTLSNDNENKKGYLSFLTYSLFVKLSKINSSKDSDLKIDISNLIDKTTLSIAKNQACSEAFLFHDIRSLLTEFKSEESHDNKSDHQYEFIKDKFESMKSLLLNNKSKQGLLSLICEHGKAIFLYPYHVNDLVYIDLIKKNKEGVAPVEHFNRKFAKEANYLTGIILLKQFLGKLDNIEELKQGGSDVIKSFLSTKSTLKHSNDQSYREIINHAIKFGNFYNKINKREGYPLALINKNHKDKTNLVKKYLNNFSLQKSLQNPPIIAISDKSLEGLEENGDFILENIRKINKSKNDQIFAESSSYYPCIGSDNMNNEGNISYVFQDVTVLNSMKRDVGANYDFPIPHNSKSYLVAVCGILAKENADLDMVKTQDTTYKKEVDDNKYKSLLIEQRLLPALKYAIKDLKQKGYKHPIIRLPYFGCGAFWNNACSFKKNGKGVKKVLTNGFREMVNNNPELFNNAVIYCDAYDVEKENKVRVLQNKEKNTSCLLIHGGDRDHRIEADACVGEYNNMIRTAVWLDEVDLTTYNLKEDDSYHITCYAADHLSLQGNELKSGSTGTDEPAVVRGTNLAQIINPNYSSIDASISNDGVFKGPQAETNIKDYFLQTFVMNSKTKELSNMSESVRAVYKARESIKDYKKKIQNPELGLFQHNHLRKELFKELSNIIPKDDKYVVEQLKNVDDSQTYNAFQTTRCEFPILKFPKK